MLDAVIWGFVQGLTEFLPVSSDGHLILVPAFLNRLGVAIGPPDLATTAVLHLGTLAALLLYYRKDLRWLGRFASDREARRVVGLLIVGTLPATVGVVVKDQIDRLGDEPRRVAGLLAVMGLILFVGSRFTRGRRRIEEARPSDALLVGVAQALALLPGISRSGMTITAGSGRGLSPAEAARFSFLLSIPAIAGAGLLEALDLVSSDAGISGPVWVGVVVAGVSGFLAITFFLRLLGKIGLAPFGAYCVLVGVLGLLFL